MKWKHFEAIIWLVFCLRVGDGIFFVYCFFYFLSAERRERKSTKKRDGRETKTSQARKRESGKRKRRKEKEKSRRNRFERR